MVQRQSKMQGDRPLGLMTEPELQRCWLDLGRSHGGREPRIDCVRSALEGESEDLGVVTTGEDGF